MNNSGCYCQGGIHSKCHACRYELYAEELAMRIVYLKLVGKNLYQIYNSSGDALTPATYFPTEQHATDWARRWSSSWHDVIIDTTALKD